MARWDGGLRRSEVAACSAHDVDRLCCAIAEGGTECTVRGVPLHTQGAQLVACALQTSRVEVLCLSSCCLADAGLDAIGSALLHQACQLKYVDVSSNNVQELGPAFLEGVEFSGSLIGLNVGSNPLTLVSINMLCRAIAAPTSKVEDLDLSATVAMVHCEPAVAALTAKLRVLRIGHSYWAISGRARSKIAVEPCCFSRSLTADLIKGKVDGKAPLANILIPAAERKDNVIEEDEHPELPLFVLLSWAKDNRLLLALQVLDLTACAIGLHECDVLRRVLPSAVGVQKLCLRHNNVTPRALVLLSEGIVGCRSLAELNLSGNPITGVVVPTQQTQLHKKERDGLYTDKGIVALTAAVSKHKALRVIDLSSCNFGFSTKRFYDGNDHGGVANLCDTVKRNVSMKQVLLHGNHFNTATRDYLRRVTGGKCSIDGSYQPGSTGLELAPSSRIDYACYLDGDREWPVRGVHS
ncbi:hypothetical protein DIPPA_31972 [Diplonema papillatum]|nr:hypothetical protein DIPPA_31972 [Diplonema papillatum]